MELAKRFVFVLTAVTLMLAVGICALVIPYIAIAIKFGIGWGIVYIVVAMAAFITIADN
jgi:hypothetical protein